MTSKSIRHLISSSFSCVGRVSVRFAFFIIFCIMLTIFTIMLILYAQKILLLCSKSPTIMLNFSPRITHFLPKIKYNRLICLYGGYMALGPTLFSRIFLHRKSGIPISRLYLISMYLFSIFYIQYFREFFLLLCWHNARWSCLTIMLKIMPA